MMPSSRVAPVVRVLVVDDSAYVRKVVTQMLSRSPFLEVIATARDGQEALELVEKHDPDVVTCDLNMPDVDGVSFIREQMARRRVPILVMTVTSASGEQALAALESGAVDIVQKPTALASERLLEVSEELIAKVKAAAALRLPQPTALPDRPESPHVLPARLNVAADIVVMGISTGGPQGLRLIMPRLPRTFPVPVAMVLHMPVGYTALYARRLDALCELEVLEAREGMEVTPGRALLAPAGQHLSFRRRGGAVYAHLDVRPLDTPHRPAVDVLFQSAAEIYGGRTLGVVMTGMGTDGLAGAAWIKAKGGQVLTESEESCVVYGMPRAVAEAGLSDAVVHIERMADAIVEHV
jgi:two-component system chemotaxis response regulator CheB